MSDFEIKASSLLKALGLSGSNEEKLAIVCCYLDDTYHEGYDEGFADGYIGHDLDYAYDRAQAEGFADGYDERDAEIPTGDNP